MSRQTELAAFVEEHSWGGVPDDLMVQLCEELLVEAEAEPPVDMRLLASFRQILEISEVDQVEAGRIWWDASAGNFRVSVRSSDPQGRQRFTQGHEICHTLFPTFHTGSRRRDDPVTGAFDANDRVEHLCDVGAAELLMPRKHFVKHVPPKASIQDVLDLAEVYGAGPTALARRVVDFSDQPVAFITLELAHKPSEIRLLNQATLPGLDGPAKRFRVQWSYRGGNLAAWPPRDKSVSDELQESLTLEDGAPRLTDDLGLLDGTFEYSASLLPYNRDGNQVERVLMLVRPVTR